MRTQLEEAPLQRRELLTSDPAEVRAYLNRWYDTDVHVDFFGARTPRAEFSHRRIDMGSFALEEVSHPADAQIRADGTAGVVVVWVVSGRAESTIERAVGIAGPGGVVLGSAGAIPLHVKTSDPRLKTTVIDPKLLTKVMSDGNPNGQKVVRFTGAEAVSPAAARAWIRAHRFVEESVLSNGAAVSPLVLAAAGRLLAATALAAFDNTTGSADEPRDHHDDHPALLRRAVAYLESHLADDIGVGDVANAVFVTPRALQYMFRRHLDTTPMAYLRRIRLDQVHHELLIADRSTTTVTAVAGRWGFAHTGRFAVLYRQTYGQSPHVTLRR